MTVEENLARLRRLFWEIQDLTPHHFLKSIKKLPNGEPETDAAREMIQALHYWSGEFLMAVPDCSHSQISAETMLCDFCSAYCGTGKPEVDQDFIRSTLSKRPWLKATQPWKDLAKYI